jgi:hypothetical protein
MPSSCPGGLAVEPISRHLLDVLEDRSQIRTGHP